MKKILFYTLFFIVNISFSSTLSYNNKTLKARELIFNFNFSKAEIILKNDNSAVSYYLKSYSYFLQNILIGGNDNYNLYENNFNDIINNLEKVNNNDSLKIFLLTEVYLQSAILKLINKDFISGSYHFIKSYNLFKESKKKFPKLQQNLKLSGMYKIIAGITPEQGKKFIELIGLEGDIYQGYKELNLYLKKVEKNKAFYVEAYTLNKLIFTFLKEDLGINKFQYTVKKDFNNNSSIVFTDILYNYKHGNYINLKQNANIIKNKNIIEIPLINYFLGVSLTLINTNESIKYLYKYIKTTKSQHFLKSTYWQLARISILQNENEKFNNLKKITLSVGENFTESDKQAEFEAKETIIPNKNLLKARLFFDARKYNDAINQLNTLEINNLKNNEYKAEYYYRYGRIEFELKNYTKSKKLFLTVLKEYIDVEKYYIPYSALNLSYIYKKENNKQKQEEFLKLALKLNKYEYQNSLKHKAKSNLKEL